MEVLRETGGRSGDGGGLYVVYNKDSLVLIMLCLESWEKILFSIKMNKSITQSLFTPFFCYNWKSINNDHERHFCAKSLPPKWAFLCHWVTSTFWNQKFGPFWTNSYLMWGHVWSYLDTSNSTGAKKVSKVKSQVVSGHPTSPGALPVSWVLVRARARLQYMWWSGGVVGLHHCVT